MRSNRPLFMLAVILTVIAAAASLMVRPAVPWFWLVAAVTWLVYLSLTMLRRRP